LNSIRALKYAVRAASLVVSVLILVVVAGPILGVLSPQFMTQQPPLGIGVDLQSVQSQLQFFSSGSTIIGTHDIVVPAFNNWPLPGGASLLLTLMVNGQTVYQTQPASIHLGAFQSGDLHITMDVSPGLVTQLRGQSIGVGGAMSISEDQFWSITVSFPQK
jgi:hypothetical protein